MNLLSLTAGRWVNAALGFFYPEVCQFCGEARATPDEGYVCEGCRHKVRFIEPPFCQRCGLPFQGALTTPFQCGNCRKQELHFRFARSAVLARDPVLEAIHRYKYHRALWFEPFLADLLIHGAQPELQPDLWDYLVPVPLHRTKQREREFNQAERLAQRLGKATGIAVLPSLLKRVRPTESQTQLSRQDRAANVRRAFALGEKTPLAGKRIVVIDDVFTTGATTNACAEVLQSGGAADVCVWTVARGA
jgi:competence protein ComFC